jgi:hypothetical protein
MSDTVSKMYFGDTNPAAKATEQEIADRLTLLLRAFPNVTLADAEVYGAALLADVIDVHPTIGEMDAASRHLRRTRKFLPRIADVLEAIRKVREPLA